MTFYNCLQVGGNRRDRSQDITEPPKTEGLTGVYALPFVYYLAIAKNTAIASPAKYTLKLPNGIINRTWIEFPSGCKGLAGIQIWRGARQIFPSPSDTWLKGDGTVLNFAFTHDVITEPFEVVLYGYNLDDTYSHTIGFVIEMSGKRKELSGELLALFEYLS